MFQGDATSRSQDVTGYPVGEKHALIVFLKQPEGSDHDWAAAEAIVAAAYWSNITLRRAGTLNGDSPRGDLTESYQAALSSGSAIVIYTDPLQ